MSTDGKVPVFTTLNIIRITYLREREVDSSVPRAKVVEEVTDNLSIHENSKAVNNGWRHYCVSLVDGSYEDILRYNQILAHL
jgi:hypothetical protein